MNHSYDEKGNLTLTINVFDYIHDITPEQRSEIIQSLSCADEIIEYVMQQVLEGCTDAGFAGSIGFYSETALSKARKDVAEKYDYASRATIKSLTNGIESLEKDVEYWRNHYEKRAYG